MVIELAICICLVIILLYIYCHHYSPAEKFSPYVSTLAHDIKSDDPQSDSSVTHTKSANPEGRSSELDLFHQIHSQALKIY